MTSNIAFVQKQQGAIEYLEGGMDNKPVIVCLHGIGSNAHSFDLLPPYLAETARIIAWNAPGYGQSNELAQNWPLAKNYADELAKFLETLHCVSVHLLCHSLGCLIGAAFARHYPDKVQSMFLVSPAVGYNEVPSDTPSEVAKSRIDDLEKLGAHDFAQKRGPRLVFEPEKNQSLTNRVVKAMGAINPHGYGQASKMLASGSLIDDVSGLTVPTHVIVGAEDIITPIDQAKEVYAALPFQCRQSFLIIPKAGHAVYQQKPEDFGAFLKMNINT